MDHTSVGSNTRINPQYLSALTARKYIDSNVTARKLTGSFTHKHIHAAGVAVPITVQTIIESIGTG